MFSDRVNFDFEFSIFEENYKQTEAEIRLNKEFEYIYFYFSDSKSILCPFKEYKSDYLNYLTSLGLILPKLDCNYPKKNWWGNDENLKLARLLNSKITSTKIAEENNLNPIGVAVINTYEDLLSHLNLHGFEKWICRDPNKMAGSGSLIFDKNELDKHKMFFAKYFVRGPIVLSPYFSRIIDLGFIFDSEKRGVTWNLNTKNGIFKGGIVFENIETLEKLVREKCGLDFKKISKVEEKIFEIFQGMGNNGIIQIDSFIYSENNLNKFFPLVEVNARKSMGYFINTLSRFLSKKGVGLFVNLNTADLKGVESFNEMKNSLGDILYSFEKKAGAIPLSPIDGIFTSFFICDLTLEKVDQIKCKLWDLISRPGKKLSPAFNFIKTV